MSAPQSELPVSRSGFVQGAVEDLLDTLQLYKDGEQIGTKPVCLSEEMIKGDIRYKAHHRLRDAATRDAILGAAVDFMAAIQTDESLLRKEPVVMLFDRWTWAVEAAARRENRGANANVKLNESAALQKQVKYAWINPSLSAGDDPKGRDMLRTLKLFEVEFYSKAAELLDMPSHVPLGPADSDASNEANAKRTQRKNVVDLFSGVIQALLFLQVPYHGPVYWSSPGDRTEACTIAAGSSLVAQLRSGPMVPYHYVLPLRTFLELYLGKHAAVPYDDIEHRTYRYLFNLSGWVVMGVFDKLSLAVLNGRQSFADTCASANRNFDASQFDERMLPVLTDMERSVTMSAQYNMAVVDLATYVNKVRALRQFADAQSAESDTVPLSTRQDAAYRMQVGRTTPSDDFAPIAKDKFSVCPVMGVLLALS